MELGVVKPLLTLLVLPPAGPLLLALAGVLWSLRRPATGLVLVAISVLALWFVSCNGVAVWLSQHALPPMQALTPAQVAGLRASGVQGIVVLGGGLDLLAPEYGESQPAGASVGRVRYGAWLARQTGLPLGFTGGGVHGMGPEWSEADAARRMALKDYGMTLRWVETESRDTYENASLTRELLARDGVRHVAIVTNAWHMPRSVRTFEAAGLQVTAAPMGYVVPRESPIPEWLPTALGLQSSQYVLREWLANQVYRWVPGR
jgi:uncharacterized SAM-binding protein YcdF (DUF218 family)